MHVNTIESAKGRWYGILKSFGMDDSYLSGNHGPCPICNSGKDRFRFDNKNGSGSYICTTCGSGYGIDLVKHITGSDFKNAAKAIDEIIGTVEAEPIKKEKSLDAIRTEIKTILGQCNRIDSMGYLAARGIQSNPDVRFHPGLDYWHEGKLLGKFPAMIGVVRDANGNGVALHRTYLQKGGKADVPSVRKMSKAVGSLNGSAIRLFKHKEVLAIGEGVESCCAFTQLFDIPCWSAINTTILESWMPPEGIKKVIVAGDNDVSFAGQRSAYILANKLSLKGYEVEVKIPDVSGHDWNDCLL